MKKWQTLGDSFNTLSKIQEEQVIKNNNNNKSEIAYLINLEKLHISTQQCCEFIDVYTDIKKVKVCFV